MTKKRKKLSSSSLQAMLMLAPMMIGFVVFTYFPIFYILRYCFYDVRGLNSTWIGMENFVRLFTRDSAYWESLINVLILAFGKLLVEIPLAMGLAVLLNKGLKGTGFFRATLFLPAIISVAITGLVFSLMFASFNGVINGLLQDLGLISQPIHWFSNKWTALFVIGLASVWNGFGINMIFFLMALQSVPKELYECSKCDGASGARTFFSIVLPSIGPTFRVVVLMAIVGSLKIIDLILTTTNGQPAGKTEVVMTYVFKYFFGQFGKRPDVGYASAMSVVTGIFLTIISLIYMKLTKKMDNVD